MTTKEKNLAFFDMFTKTESIGKTESPKQAKEPAVKPKKQEREIYYLFEDADEYHDCIYGAMPENEEDWVINQ